MNCIEIVKAKGAIINRHLGLKFLNFQKIFNKTIDKLLFILSLQAITYL